MSRYDEARAAIIALIKERGFQIGEAFSMYVIGTALVPAGFSEAELVRAIEELLREKVVEMVPGTNSVRLLPPAVSTTKV